MEGFCPPYHHPSGAPLDRELTYTYCCYVGTLLQPTTEIIYSFYCTFLVVVWLSELLWKAISLVGQKVLKRLFILNVAMLVESGLVQAINLVLVGSICTTAYKQEKSPSITFMPLTTTYILRLSSSRSGKKNLHIQMCKCGHQKSQTQR